MQKTREAITLEVLDKFMKEDNPPQAITKHIADNYDKFIPMEAYACDIAYEIAYNIFQAGSRRGNKIGIRSVIDEINERFGDNNNS